MKTIILLFLPTLAYSGFKEAPDSSLYQYKVKTQQYKVKRKQNTNKKVRNKQIDELIEKDMAILNLLKKQEKNVIMKRRDNKVTALTRIKGIVLNSILAMNVKPSKFIVKITDKNHDLYGAEIRCLGFSFEKRVPSKCDLLVIEDKEYSTDIELWDQDGAEGMIADYYYSGEEKAFLTSSFASFLGATFSVAKSGVNTPFGNVSQNTAKNKIMDGLLSVSENAKEKIMESGERKLTISYVNSGKEVLVFFNKTLNLTTK